MFTSVAAEAVWVCGGRCVCVREGECEWVYIVLLRTLLKKSNGFSDSLLYYIIVSGAMCLCHVLTIVHTYIAL